MTARQRVELPRPGYYPCLDTAKEDHITTLLEVLCRLLPIPLPSAGVRVRRRRHNLPDDVQPDRSLACDARPLQLFDWQKLKSNGVTSEYFKLLMHTVKTKRVHVRQ